MALRKVTAKVTTETTVVFQANTREEADYIARDIIRTQHLTPNRISVEIIDVGPVILNEETARARIEELTEMIVDLRVDLAEANLPEGYCVYSGYGNPIKKDVDCYEIGCDECRAQYFEKYRELVRQEMNPDFEWEESNEEN